ncbi:MAG TPA: hypothetical protein VN688_18690 [Gemmataceae bacterium]|nr:hypothetical protein [Gemmataceae bacterium]
MNTIAIEQVQRVGSDSGAERTVVEVPLLLEVRQLAALEAAANARGLTAAMMTRRLIHDFVCHVADLV